MPKRTLYTIVTDLLSPTVLNGRMEVLFSDALAQYGIPNHTTNAMANVVGKEADSTGFRLFEVKRNPSAFTSSNAAGYAADDVSRYFFEYSLGDEVFILEYSRFEHYELRGSRWAAGAWHDLSLIDGKTKEAIVAMLYAIMLAESNAGTFATIAAQFAREYNSMFTCGPNQGISIVKELYCQLKDNVDPRKEGEMEAPFKANSTFLNAHNSCLKRLMHSEKIGYTMTDNPRVFFASDLQTTLCIEGGNVERIETQLIVLDGILKTITPSTITKLEANMYPINPDRVYDEEDRSRLLTIPDWYIPVLSVLNIAKAVAGSSVFKKPFRNIMMRGPAGSGKTEGAKALATMFGSPYGVITGHAEMEFFDLTSNLFPNTDSPIQSDAELYDYFLYAMRDSDLVLPSFLEIASMPDVIYEHITGRKNDQAGEAECFAALVSKLMSACKKDISMFGGENSKFKVVHSDLTLGFQKGWLVELQEMNTILKPGVLVGLNNILEHGQLRLPTGEVIQRHPDTVVVFTQNVGYAGTTDGNQSVYSRIEVKCDLNHPSEDEMVSRIQSHVPNLSEADCRTIVQTVIRVQENCPQEIEGGSVGTREAINWAKMTVLLNGDMRAAAELTILPSVGEDPDDIDLVRTNIHQSIAETN